MRPRVRITIANPMTLNWKRAYLDSRTQGFTIVNLRELVRTTETRVAATPSGYPQFFVFPQRWRPGSREVLTIDSSLIWGWYSFRVGDLEKVTPQGRAADPMTWYHGNALRIREDFPECEQRILRLPTGVAKGIWRFEATSQ